MEIIQITDSASILVSLFFFALGSLFDLKTREVDDRVWLIYGPIGVSLTILRLFTDPSQLLLTIVSIIVTTLISFGLFYFGLYGGADAKAIICLGLTIPLVPSASKPLIGYLHPLFPVVVTLTGFISSASIAVWFAVRNSLTYARIGNRMFEGLESEPHWKKVVAILTGYPSEVSKLRSTFYLYPMEKIIEGTNTPHRSFNLYFGAETDRELEVSKFTESLSKLDYRGKVWVTPGLPMLLFILVGLIVTLILGDVVFSTVFLLARR